MKRLLLPLGIACVSAIAGDPFVGKWKLNPAKSAATGDTIRIEALAGGDYKITAGEISDAFRMDGKEYPSHFGQTIAASQLSERAWQLQTSKNGRALWTEKWELVPDGATANITVSGTGPDGRKFEDKIVRTRPDASSGLAGAWTAWKVSLSAPDLFEIRASGGDGQTVIVPALHGSVRLMFDGRDYPLRGAGVPEGATQSGRRIGARSLEITDKIKGRVVAMWRRSVSPDGRTLTQTGQEADSGKPFLLVFDRQH